VFAGGKSVIGGGARRAPLQTPPSTTALQQRKLHGGGGAGSQHGAYRVDFSGRGGGGQLLFLSAASGEIAVPGEIMCAQCETGFAFSELDRLKLLEKGMVS